MAIATVQRWSEGEFLANQAQWDGLLQASPANPLFLSWHWASQWWAHWGRSLPGAELCVLAALDDRGQLQGIAPLYLTRTRYAGLVPVTRLQLLGSCYRRGTIRSEYQGFIARHETERAATAALVKHAFEQLRWDEWFVSDLEGGGTTAAVLAERAEDHGYRRPEQSQPPYRIDCRTDFASYVAGLGKNTRLKLYNRRKLLAERGEVRFRVDGVEGFDSAVEDLNRFHRARWGKAAFDGPMRAFHRGLSQSLSESDSVFFHRLLLNDRPVAISVDYLAGGVLYNMQLGFAEAPDNKVSYGTLLLGYLIEAACANPRIAALDLLAGSGKRSDYKAHLAAARAPFISQLIVRNPLHKTLYRVYDRLRK